MSDSRAGIPGVAASASAPAAGFLAGRLSLVDALAAGVSPLTLSDDRELLAELLAGRPEAEDAIVLAAGYFLRLAKGPLAATEAEVRALCGDAVTTLAPNDWEAVVVEIAGFYERAAERGAVAVEVARAAQRTRPQLPTSADPAAQAVDSFVACHGTYAGIVLRRLATLLDERGRDHLSATPEDLIAFLTLERPELNQRARATHASFLRMFYLEQLAADRVKLEVAVAAGAVPFDLSPHYYEARAFLDRHPGTEGWRSALLRYSALLQDRGEDPLTATPETIRAFGTEGSADRAPTTIVQHVRGVKNLYAELATRGLVRPSQAIAAGVDARDASPDRDALREAWAVQSDREALTALVNALAAADTSPLSATAPELQTAVRAYVERLDREQRIAFSQFLRRFYKGQHAAGRVPRELASAAVALATEVGAL